jgi:hypothetical protein
MTLVLTSSLATPIVVGHQADQINRPNRSGFFEDKNENENKEDDRKAFTPSAPQ